MRWVRLAGACALATVLFGVVWAAGAGASGLPAWFECAVAPGSSGNYTDGVCSAASEPGAGGFELREGVGKGKAIKGTSGVVRVHTVIPGKGDIVLECGAAKDEGKPADVAGRGELVGVKIEFTKCSSTGAPCQSSGAKSGEIRSNTLIGVLGHLEEGGIGVELTSEAAPGSGFLSEFTCTGLSQVRTHGGVIGKLGGDVNAINKTGTVTYTVGTFFGEPLPGYKPLVNTPSFDEGETTVLLAEFGNEKGFEPEGGLPTGEEAIVTNVGEALGAFREGNAPVERGAVAGTITDTAPGPVAGAVVSFCGISGCYHATTAGDGSYTISGVGHGAYTASVSPPAGSPDNAGTSAQFTVSGTAMTTVNVTLTRPTPPPNGTVVEGNGSAEIGGNVVPRVFWQSESPISTKACVGGTVTVTITAVNITNGETETSSPRTLTESPASSGTFVGNLPAVYPLHGVGDITITISGCAKPSEEESVEVTIYIDPSGLVVDANNGDAPVAGATVTLLSAETLGGSYTPVENGSVVMSPANRANPDTTDAEGKFGWDTVPGFYEVTASKPGCGSVTTPAFEVPPPVTNLRLVLHCMEELKVQTSSLPPATRGVAYSTTFAATGGVTPYKWKKTAPLPKGLKLSKAGVLSGTPSTRLAPGSYSVAVAVSDSEKPKQTALATLTLEVS